MKILKEETQYHHGSFKDLQTVLDKNGDPYTLIKSEYPQDRSKNNQNQQNNNQQQQNQNSQQQDQKKVPPDPNASYVDVNTGFEYKWDPQKNQFMKVGKYRAK